ncbi:MAG: hypothetical protein HY863_00140 [Chloroflexi bacterium]|nr:hypothetical protein [Chloroflexota bacterium]
MKKSYFGIVALVAAILSILFLGANYVASQLSISPATFNSLNSLTAMVACSLAPFSILLGFVGFIRKNDSKLISGIAVVFVGIPFLILVVRMVFSLIRVN